MKRKKSFSQEELRYLKLLAQQYPTVQAASSEIINLQAILNLPKGTEHFISDVHGEHEAFLHILNSCSGVIREKVDDLFASTISKGERDELATLIYYPEEKLEQLHRQMKDMDEWYRITLHRLIEVCRFVTSKYTRSKVRKALPKDYAYIIDELIHTNYAEADKRDYFENIISTIIDLEQADGFIEAVSAVIKRMAVDHMHIVGDIFDRGPRADIIMDSLLDYHSVDIQWGNHDILWMGAASGSRTLVATVLANSIHYNNLEVIETGYGISLRPLSVFANEVYKDCDVHRFAVKLTGPDADQYSEKDKLLSARMHKAITIILFKLEGQKLRHPEYGMSDRLLLDKIDYQSKCITIGDTTYPLEDVDFPTVDPKDPYTLTPEEDTVINQLTASFLRSEKLQKHIRFLYSKGSLYKVFNGNLLFHGCIPMTANGELLSFQIGGKERKGQEFLDYADRRPPGLLPQAGHPRATAGHGLSLVPLGRTQQPHLRPGPDDHLRAPAHQGRERLDRAQEPLLHLLPGPRRVRYAPQGIRPGRPPLPHHQRPHPRQVQEGRESHQGRRQAHRHRRRLLQSLPAHHRHCRIHPHLQLLGAAHRLPRALLRSENRHREKHGHRQQLPGL